MIAPFNPDDPRWPFGKTLEDDIREALDCDIQRKPTEDDKSYDGDP